ncbi:MAG TPA: MDR family MFS transporter [Methylomirabilota bacterium]|jgi:EmrB/QacA subfamily drug resistance transporter
MEEAQKRRVLVGVMLSVFLAAMESTVVATAMPTVVGALGGIHIYSWVFSGFLLTSTVTMPLWGRLSDLFGRRPTFLTGLAVFLIGSALSGLAQGMVELIIFRMLQGLGAGSLMTIGMTIIGELFGLERRAKMQGYISGVWGVAALVGPLLGGFLTDHVSWRAVFYINVPFGAIAMALIATALREENRARRRPVIDYAGLVLFAAGVSALLLGVLEAGRTTRWTGADVVAPLVTAAAALTAFTMVERRAPEPIVPLRLFRNRIVLAAGVTGFMAGMAMFGAISFVPLFLQSVNGASATQAGFVLTPFILGWVSLSVTSARLVLRIGYRVVVVTGMVCLTVAFLLFTRWNVGLSLAGAMRDVLIAGVGMGMTMVPMLIAVQSAVTRADLGSATSVTQFLRTVGGAVGLSIMGAVMTQRLAAGLPMASALHGVFVVGFAVCVGAFLSAFLVPGGRARDLAQSEMRGEPSRVGG